MVVGLFWAAVDKMATGRFGFKCPLTFRSAGVDYRLATQIATKCISHCPELTGAMGIEGLDISKHIVGLRPSRKGGVRVEIERTESGLVVHNYGISRNLSLL